MKVLFTLIVIAILGTALTGCSFGDTENGKGKIANFKFMYDGEFKDGKFHGEGMLKLMKDNSTYNGEFKHGKYDGKGTIYWGMDSLDGYYDGHWKKGLKEGKGTRVWPIHDETYEGATYVGNWSNDLQNGHGVLSWEDGVNYDGKWKDGEFHGKATYSFPDGDVYVGEWKNGENPEFDAWLEKMNEEAEIEEEEIELDLI